MISAIVGEDEVAGGMPWLGEVGIADRKDDPLMGDRGGRAGGIEEAGLCGTAGSGGEGVRCGRAGRGGEGGGATFTPSDSAGLRKGFLLDIGDILEARVSLR